MTWLDPGFRFPRPAAHDPVKQTAGAGWTSVGALFCFYYMYIYINTHTHIYIYVYAYVYVFDYWGGGVRGGLRVFRGGVSGCRV